MANTRQTATARGWDVEERIMHNHQLVREHIEDLLREGAVLRAERLEAEHRSSLGRAATDRHRPAPAGARALRPARVRIGRWLVAAGLAVAGSAGESRGTSEQAGRVV